ncbi:hypothetical protein PILCRDRAFT_450249 [Piloderma croceum F 1598]|uniref:Uncharacterized protein n=1 Tax=Piloderma croceum (strain F 1598) TaxID=765440 RepID=A0A0C3C0F0_PILCF|nr:hypothetical protein PILCRDRAFT_450249 [Piloderma croceum F 1598]
MYVTISQPNSFNNNPNPIYNIQKQDLFSPYEPPVHHPSHSQLYPRVKAENADADNNQEALVDNNQLGIKAEEREEKPRLGDYIEKYDPYDEGPSSPPPPRSRRLLIFILLFWYECRANGPSSSLL